MYERRKNMETPSFLMALGFPCPTLQQPYPSITVAVVFGLGFVLSSCNTYTYCFTTCCSIARYEPVKGRTGINFVFVSPGSNIVLDIGQVHNKYLLLIE